MEVFIKKAGFYDRIEDFNEELEQILQEEIITDTAMNKLRKTVLTFAKLCLKLRGKDFNSFMECIAKYIKCINKYVEFCEKDSVTLKRCVRVILEIDISKRQRTFLNHLMPVLFNILEEAELPCWCMKMLLRVFNTILYSIRKKTLQKYFKQNNQFFDNLANGLIRNCDFVYQVMVIEIIKQFSIPRQFTRYYFPEWKNLGQQFVTCCTGRNFNQAVRSFLNTFNSFHNKIFSIKCEFAILDNTLICPPEGYEQEEVWIDFNVDCKTVNIMCYTNFLESSPNLEISGPKDEWESIQINEENISNVLIIRWLTGGKSGGSVICLTLTNSCSLMYTSNSLTCFKQLTIKFLSSDKLAILEDKVLPKIFGEKVMKKATSNDYSDVQSSNLVSLILEDEGKENYSISNCTPNASMINIFFKNNLDGTCDSSDNDTIHLKNSILDNIVDLTNDDYVTDLSDENDNESVIETEFGDTSSLLLTALSSCDNSNIMKGKEIQDDSNALNKDDTALKKINENLKDASVVSNRNINKNVGKHHVKTSFKEIIYNKKAERNTNINETELNKVNLRNVCSNQTSKSNNEMNIKIASNQYTAQNPKVSVFEQTFNFKLPALHVDNNSDKDIIGLLAYEKYLATTLGSGNSSSVSSIVSKNKTRSEIYKLPDCDKIPTQSEQNHIHNATDQSFDDFSSISSSIPSINSDEINMQGETNTDLTMYEAEEEIPRVLLAENRSDESFKQNVSSTSLNDLSNQTDSTDDMQDIGRTSFQDLSETNKNIREVNNSVHNQLVENNALNNNCLTKCKKSETTCKILISGNEELGKPGGNVNSQENGFHRNNEQLNPENQILVPTTEDLQELLEDLNISISSIMSIESWCGSGKIIESSVKLIDKQAIENVEHINSYQDNDVLVKDKTKEEKSPSVIKDNEASNLTKSLKENSSSYIPVLEKSKNCILNKSQIKVVNSSNKNSNSCMIKENMLSGNTNSLKVIQNIPIQKSTIVNTASESINKNSTFKQNIQEAGEVKKKYKRIRTMSFSSEESSGIEQSVVTEIKEGKKEPAVYLERMQINDIHTMKNDNKINNSEVTAVSDSNNSTTSIKKRRKLYNPNDLSYMDSFTESTETLSKGNISNYVTMNSRDSEGSFYTINSSSEVLRDMNFNLSNTSLKGKKRKNANINANVQNNSIDECQQQIDFNLASVIKPISLDMKKAKKSLGKVTQEKKQHNKIRFCNKKIKSKEKTPALLNEDEAVNKTEREESNFENNIMQEHYVEGEVNPTTSKKPFESIFTDSILNSENSQIDIVTNKINVLSNVLLKPPNENGNETETIEKITKFLEESNKINLIQRQEDCSTSMNEEINKQVNEEEYNENVNSGVNTTVDPMLKSSVVGGSETLFKRIRKPKLITNIQLETIEEILSPLHDISVNDINITTVLEENCSQPSIVSSTKAEINPKIINQWITGKRSTQVSPETWKRIIEHGMVKGQHSLIKLILELLSGPVPKELILHYKLLCQLDNIYELFLKAVDNKNSSAEDPEVDIDFSNN